MVRICYLKISCTRKKVELANLAKRAIYLYTSDIGLKMELSHPTTLSMKNAKIKLDEKKEKKD